MVAVVFLVAREIVKMEDPMAEIKALGLYMLTVVIGVLLHGFVVLPSLYFLLVRKNSYKFLRRLIPAMATGCATANA